MQLRAMSDSSEHRTEISPLPLSHLGHPLLFFLLSAISSCRVRSDRLLMKKLSVICKISLCYLSFYLSLVQTRRRLNQVHCFGIFDSLPQYMWFSSYENLMNICILAVGEWGGGGRGKVEILYIFHNKEERIIKTRHISFLQEIVPTKEMEKKQLWHCRMGNRPHYPPSTPSPSPV